MKQIKIGNPVMPPVAHIGVVVGDLDKAVDYYTLMFGLGAFRFSSARLNPDINAFGHGPLTLKLAHCDMGNMTFEMMQVVEGDSAQSGFLRSNGDGIHHLGFKVNDLNEWVLKMENEG